MKTIRRPAAAAAWAEGRRQAGETVGFVPTMGALHEGHLSLIRRARRENDRVAVSIFVNPSQFGPGEDLSRYPRPFRRDTALCRAAGVDLLFVPGPRDMYAPDHETWVTVERLSTPLCGGFRPGHFRGVATVVLKLLNILRPDRAYFGEKDFQQLRVIQRLARDLNVPGRIVPCPTVREADGLALSSRNATLSPSERRLAPALALALRRGGQVLQSRRDAGAVRAAVRQALGRLAGVRVQYVDVVDPATLAPWAGGRRPALIAAAVRLGRTRLIDNIRIGPPPRDP